jgi:hypothetical protein
VSDQELKAFAAQPLAGGTPALYKYDFSAMDLVQPLPGYFCAPTVVYIAGVPSKAMQCVAIKVNNLVVEPQDSAWGLAKIFALQGAAYHMLFVTHPALHFPMDSVNAITKTAVPRVHPLFQLLYPHTSYTLALDNAVQESDQSVVNDHAGGCWFDPLTGDAPNLKELFGAGYGGLPAARYGDSYPAYDYMNPALLGLNSTGSARAPVLDTPYARWQQAYFQRAFLPFCQAVAKRILSEDRTDSYVKRWATYLSVCVKGFPDGTAILDPDVLAKAMAIYMWDVTVSHGADHYSFGAGISAANKFLRIRRAPPSSKNDAPVKAGEISTGDDRFRAEMAQVMFFGPSAIPPNLSETRYAFTDPVLADAQQTFQASLLAVSKDTSLTQFMPFDASQDPKVYPVTIPASIQY